MPRKVFMSTPDAVPCRLPNLRRRALIAASLAVFVLGRPVLSIWKPSALLVSSMTPPPQSSADASNPTIVESDSSSSPGRPLPSRPSLRLDWTNLPPLSSLARRIGTSQSRCPRPGGRDGGGTNGTTAVDREEVRVKIERHPATAGLGSNLHTWAQRLCEAVEHGAVMRTVGPWRWATDVDGSGGGGSCRRTERTNSPPFSVDPMTCYFGRHVGGSSCDDVDWTDATAVERLPRMSRRWAECRSVQSLEAGGYSVEEWMAASMEWLFQSVDSSVVDEARTQLEEVYPDGAPNPDDLVTVHVRRGDKVINEMAYQSTEKYVEAVRRLAASRPIAQTDRPLHIYLATVDPAIHKEFSDAAPREWKVHRPSRRLAHDTPGVSSANWTVKRWMSGAHGLASLGALLVELQANNYVLTTESNWSRLINELRKNVLNPRCGNCTRMLDLRYGEWPKLGPGNEIQFSRCRQKYNGSAWIDPSGLILMDGA